MTMFECFLSDHTEEFQSHALIVQDNLRATKETAKQIDEQFNYICEQANLQNDKFSKSGDAKKRDTKAQLTFNNDMLKSRSLKLQIQEKEKSLKKLKDQLNNLTEQYENYKSEQDKEYHSQKSTLSAYQKALKHFTNCLQYAIDVEETNDAKKYCVVIKFILNKLESKYPIKFIFEVDTDKLLEFDAGTLLTEEEHKDLLDRYQRSRNNVALICALRSIVVTRENL